MSYLLLDIGNVLINFDTSPFVKSLVRHANIGYDDAERFVNSVQKQQDLGLTTIVDEAEIKWNLPSFTLDDLRNRWLETVKPNNHSIDFMNDLIKKYNLKVALLSNLGVEHANLFTSVLAGNEVYDKSIHHFSCKVGARKPTRLYYKLFLEEYPEFNGALYLDDIHENLETGKKMGLNTFHFDLSKYSKQETQYKLEEVDKYFTT